MMILACRYRNSPRYVPALLLKRAYKIALNGDQAFYAVGGRDRIRKIKMSTTSKHYKQTICILEKPPAYLEGTPLLISSSSKVLRVTDSHPQSYWQCISEDRWMLRYYFSHSKLLPENTIAGIRLHCDKQGEIDIIFESDREKKAYRLLELSRATHSSLLEVCHGYIRQRDDHANPWNRWGEREEIKGLLHHNFSPSKALASGRIHRVCATALFGVVLVDRVFR